MAFPTLLAARERTLRRLEERRRALQAIEGNNDVAIVLMGSWGRLEVTGGSDDDFMCLVDGKPRPESDVQPSVETAWKALGSSTKRPGKEDIFGVPVFSSDLRTIGLDEDGNKNLTRRMLLLLESKSAAGDEVLERVKQELIDSYLRDLDLDFHPPRFLLNDIFRYWRTIAVDFERKHRDRYGREWGLRNAKLRTSRPLLFASGLLPALECRQLRTQECSSFLTEQFRAPPLDRIAACFLRHGRADSGVRTLLAYDSFLAMLDDRTTRSELETLAYEKRADSDTYRVAKQRGDDIREGLLSLMFETRDLYEMVREYAIF